MKKLKNLYMRILDEYPSSIYAEPVRYHIPGITKHNKFMKSINLYFFFYHYLFRRKVMIPMDQEQNNHLKAYGIAFFGLTKNMKIEWLLNYRGGSFLFDADQIIASECRLRGYHLSFYQALIF